MGPWSIANHSFSHWKAVHSPLFLCQAASGSPAAPRAVAAPSFPVHSTGGQRDPSVIRVLEPAVLDAGSSWAALAVLLPEAAAPAGPAPFVAQSAHRFLLGLQVAERVSHHGSRSD